MGRHRNVLAKMLAGLIQCANTLFVCEEELMKQFRYPGYEDHMQEHRLFIVQMCELQKNYVAGMRVLNQHSMAYLKDWLQYHLLREDKKYGPFLNKKGIV